MLQRAANNAYSWWWASHIRTKQSKWMEQNLQDMEEKVAAVIKLIEEDGDSFARRAEMYYKKRPELIHFVEDSYRAYRALAERYDHISTELQNANNMIASVFPEQLHFAMDDEEEFGSPRFSKKSSENSKVGSPKVPKLPVKDLKGWVTSGAKKMQHKISTKGTMAAVSKSGLTKAEGLKEIGRLQKQILALQTEKEFARSSYESGLAKYWEIDNQIKEIQERLSSLEDEFGEGRVIEDDEARTVMETTALRSCRDTLVQLQERQERSVIEAEVEQKRIKDARDKLNTFKNKFLSNEENHEKPSAGIESGIAVKKPQMLEQEVGHDAGQKRKEIEALREKIKQHFEVVLGESLTVTEMAEKIDELVNNVINLENAVSSQTALIQRLRAETDELQAQIKMLEDDKVRLTDGENDLRNKLREMEEKFREIQGLSQSVEDQNNNLQTYFTEAHCNLDHLSEKVHSTVPDEKLEKEKSSSVALVSSKEMEIKESDNMLKKVRTGKELEVADELDNSPAEVKSQIDSDKMLTKVKTGKELEGADASENSPAEIKSQKDSDKMPKKVKTGKELEVTDALDNSPADADSQKDSNKMLKKVETGKELEVADAADNNPVEAKSQKYSDKMLKKVKTGKELEVADASEKSSAEAKSQKESAEQESRNLDATDGCKNLQSPKPEMVMVSGSLQKEEDSLVKVELPKESEERGEKLDHDDGFPKGGNGKLEGREDAKEHESVTTSTNGDVSHETSRPSEECEDLTAEDRVDERACLQTVDIIAKVESKEQEKGQEDEPDWKQLYLKGMEDREQNLLMEYTIMLKDYKDTKKKLMEVEANNQNSLFEIMLQLKELKSSHAMKDEVIRSLREDLSLLQTGLGRNNNTDQYVQPRVSSEKSVVIETSTTLPAEKELKEDIEVMLINQSQTTSAIEEKFQMIIDELLEENLDFWFRFSTVFQEVKKFKARVKDLTAEVLKLEERQKQGGSSTPRYSVKSDVQPLYKHLTEVQNELTVWVGKSVLLKEELKNRFSSLCEIQEEITKALKASAEDDEFKFTSYQAAKFQGEILNMKQENTKVADELQAGLNHVTTLQLEVERAQTKLAEDWGLSGSKSHESGQLQHSVTRSRIPLSAFIFGNKPKQQKTSLFSCVLHPAMQRKNSGLRSGHSSNR